MIRRTPVAALVAAVTGCDVGSVTLDLSSFETFEYSVRPAFVSPRIESAIVCRTQEGTYTATIAGYAECVNGSLQHSFEFEPATVMHLLTADEAGAMLASFGSVQVQLYFVPWVYFDVGVETLCWDSLCGNVLKQFPGGISVSETKALDVRGLLEAMLTAELCAEQPAPSAKAIANAD